ncbi:MAG TPA: PilZ domain-containing protein [Stellaceae bacterium]|nr:PilZ domain-containing protein [Stellaceae bacterium]
MDARQTSLERGRAAPAAKAERRRHRRRQVVWQGKIETRDSRLVACAVLNLSLGGAMVAADGAFAAGDWIKLSITRIGSVEAEIVWHDDGHLGVRFLDDPARIAGIFGGALTL